MAEFEYFVGVNLPPKETSFFIYLRKLHQPNRPISSPPHITLLPPFQERNITLFEASLEKWAQDKESFKVEFKKIAVYKHLKYATIVLEPEKGEEIKKLKRSLDEWLKWPLRERRFFRPHLTLINHLTYNRLHLVKEEIRKYNLKVDLRVQGVMLYQRQLGSQWQEYRFFSFGPKSAQK